MKGWSKKISRLVRANRFLVKPVLVMFLIYLVGMSAIILAGVHYADDIARTNYGYAGWTGFSRYFSTIASMGLHADSYLTNIYPLPQLIAVVLLAVASVALVCVVLGKKVFKEKWTRWIWYLIAVVPLGLSPYMLECLAYQYDAPYMAVSALFAVLPLLFSKCRRWIYGLAIFVGVIIICTSYQAAVGIIPMLVVIKAVKNWSEGDSEESGVKKGMRGCLEKNDENGLGKNVRRWGNLKFVIYSAVVFIISLLFFQLVLMKPRDAYVSNSLPEFNNLIPEFFEHLGRYFGLVMSDFKIWWLILIGIIGVGFVVLFVMRSKKNKILAGAAAVAVEVFLFVMAFCFYAVLDKPLYATRAMYPIGATLAILGVYVVSGKGVLAKCMRVPVLVLSWCFLVFALTFGNALREQDKYRNMVEDMVISDLNGLKMMQDGKVRSIQVSGNLGFAPVILHMPQEYKILDRLMMPSFSEYVPWMAARITEQSGLPNLVYSETVKMEEMELPLIKETVFYDIMGDKDNILIKFKDTRTFNVIF